jgi:hypothetical protein
MAETRDLDALTRRVSSALTLALFGATLGAAYGWGRIYKRWSKENHLFAEPRAKVDRLRTDYQSKKATATEVGGAIGVILVEALASEVGRLRR